MSIGLRLGSDPCLEVNASNTQRQGFWWEGPFERIFLFFVVVVVVVFGFSKPV